MCERQLEFSKSEHIANLNKRFEKDTATELREIIYGEQNEHLIFMKSYNNLFIMMDIWVYHTLYAEYSFNNL